MKNATALLAVLAATSCFDPVDPPAGSSDTDGNDVSSTGVIETKPSTSEAETTAGSTTGMGSSEGSTDGAASSGPPGPETESSSATGEPQLGPQLVDSQPLAGDHDAGLDGFFLLHFDRPVAQGDALGHIFVTQSGGDPILVSPQPCPPDADPQCVAGIFPEAFTDPQTGRLPGATEHTIIVSADLPDLDGNTNTVDRVVEFRTFDFTANWHDDSATLSGELGGMVFDPDNGALFLSGTTSQGGDCIVRRVDIEGGVASAAITVATPVAQGGGPYCYGMQKYGDTLYVDMSYSGDVRAYTGLEQDDLDPTEVIIADPTLPAPHDTLDQVVSTAQVGPRRFFSFASFFGGPQAFAVLEFTDGNWSIFQSGSNLWMPGDEVFIATADIGGTPYMFAHAGETLYKFRVSDATVVDEIPSSGGNNPDIEVDAFGRVWIGSNGHLAVYDGDDLSELAVRDGMDTGRIGVDASADEAVVYFARYRDPAVVGRMRVELP